MVMPSTLYRTPGPDTFCPTRIDVAAKAAPHFLLRLLTPPAAELHGAAQAAMTASCECCTPTPGLAHVRPAGMQPAAMSPQECCPYACLSQGCRQIVWREAAALHMATVGKPCSPEVLQGRQVVRLQHQPRHMRRQLARRHATRCFLQPQECCQQTGFLQSCGRRRNQCGSRCCLPL
jgi:hypothetical protein